MGGKVKLSKERVMKSIVNGRTAKAKVIAKSTYTSKYDKVSYHASVEDAINSATRGQEIDEHAAFRMYYYEVYERRGNKWVEVEW